MEYNTTRPLMIIREYGRAVQNMIAFACTIEDRDKRNDLAQSIVRVMAQLSPQQGDIEEWRHKLYDHLFIISDFQLDIDSPYPIPSRETLLLRPEMIRYPSNGIRFKHYGRSLQQMIIKAADFPEGEEKNTLLRQLIQQMKRAYMMWNKNTLTDELIAEQLRVLSDGKISYTPEMQSDLVPELPESSLDKKRKKTKKFKKKIKA